MTATSPTGHRRVAPLRRRGLVAGVAGAGGVHIAVGLHHGLGTAHGALFLTVGVVQAVLAIGLDRRSDARRLLASVAVNTTVAAIWVMAHVGAITDGGVDGLGVTATLLEIAAVLLALVALRHPVGGHPSTLGNGALVLTGLVALAVTTFADAGHTGHHHEPAGRAAEPTAADSPIFGDLFSDRHHRASPAHDHPGDAGAPNATTSRSSASASQPAGLRPVP